MATAHSHQQIPRAIAHRALQLRNALPEHLRVFVRCADGLYEAGDSLHDATQDSLNNTKLCVDFPVGPNCTIEIREQLPTRNSSPPELPILKLLSEAHHELTRAFEQCDALASQSTHWLEEACFLRQLASLLDLSAGHAIKDILKDIGNDLRILSQAETLIIAAPDSVSPHEHDVSQYGIALADEIVRQLLEFVADLGGTTVNNDFVALSSRFGDRVRSLLAVPITVPHANGWFLAVNSTSPDGFGTVEASLLETTASVIAVHGSNVTLLKELEKFLVDMVQALVSAIDAKDPYTCGHSARVAHVARCIAEELGLDSETCHNVFLAGLLHDVGKIGVEDRVLRKPDRLTDEEFEEIKKHPRVGYRILQHLQRLAFALPGVLYHHERIDGKGYPDGLVGDKIPLIARIIAVADSFDAMASDRPYRKGMPLEKVLRILQEGAGSQWDEQVVKAFLNAFDRIYEVWQSYNKPQLSFEDLKGTTVPAPSRTHS